MRNTTRILMVALVLLVIVMLNACIKITGVSGLCVQEGEIRSTEPTPEDPWNCQAVEIPDNVTVETP